MSLEKKHLAWTLAINGYSKNIRKASLVKYKMK